MVIQPSPYSYVWFGAQQRDFNVEVKVGCKDTNSVDYCEDCQVEDNSRCGPCNAGWTKTNDPNMKCWAVGSMSVDCANGQIFYHPMGCSDSASRGAAHSYTSDKDCTCGQLDLIISYTFSLISPPDDSVLLTQDLLPLSNTGFPSVVTAHKTRFQE